MSFELHNEPNKLELLSSISEGIEAERLNLAELESQIQADPECAPNEKKVLLFQLQVEKVRNERHAQFAERLQQAA